MQYTYVSLQTGVGWQNIDLISPISDDERLTIIPINSSVAHGATNLLSVSVSPLPPLGTTFPAATLQIGEEVIINASGTWTWGGTNTVDPTGSSALGDQDFRLPGARKWSLIGRIDTGPWFYIGDSLTFIAQMSGALTLGMNDDFYPDNGGNLSVEIRTNSSFCGLKGRIGAGSEFAIGWEFDDYPPTSGVLQLAAEGCDVGEGTISALVIVGAPGIPNHNGECPICHDAEPRSQNPIQLRTGTKLITEIDITVHSPTGLLTFSRNYNQSKQTDNSYQFMGLGWSHNHRYQLSFSGASPNRLAEVSLPEGGTLKLDEVNGNPDTFTARPGSNSKLEHDTGNNEYILTAQDKSRFHFDDTTLQLLTRDWPNNEVLFYTYDLSGRLAEISDDYGRKLKFVYVANPGQYNHGQLWRIGDHNTSNLDSSPVGRYVEFTYTPEKLNGITLDSPKALLASGRDVRGSYWLYDYYGQVSGESNSALGNLLTKRRSPSIDSTGDGVADGALTLEQLSYFLSGSTLTKMIQQRGNGLLATEYRFQVDGKNITTETLVGVSTIIGQRTKIHHFANGVYVGVANPAGEASTQVLNESYRPQSQADALMNESRLDWDATGKLLNSVTDALNHETSFTYNPDDTLDAATDAEGRSTEYTYGDIDNPRLPTRIKVLGADGTTVLRWQEFEYNNKGRTLEENTLDPTDGTTLQKQTTRTYGTSGDGNGLLEEVTNVDLITPANNVSTTYTYDGAGRVIMTQQSSVLGSCQISYTVYDHAGNIVASICNYENMGSPPTNAAEATALYNPSEPDKNRVTTHVFDPLNRRIKTTTNAGASFAQTTITVYDALSRVVRTIGNYVPDVAIPHPYTAAQNTFDHGTNDTQNLVTDTTYNARGMMRKQADVLGKITLFGYDEADRLIKTIQFASQPNYNNDYGGTAPDPDLSNYSVNSDPDSDIVTLSEYDAAGNLVKTVDALGNTNFTVYDALNRPPKTVRSAKETATIEFDEGDTGYSAANDPRSASYVPSSEPDQDIIDLTEYDAMGRVRRTQDTIGTWTLYGYDALGRQVRVIRSASNPNYDIDTDPDLSAYTASSDADQDIITQTVYDEAGRILYTEDSLERRTWFAYDGLGRQFKTIANAVGTATDDGVDDPRSSSYVLSTDSDKDLISVTNYDSDGRVQWVHDKPGRKTWYVYDEVGRRIKTIVNCTYVSGSPAPEDPGYTGSSDSDDDIITTTEYDAQGRVFATIDPAGNETRYFYDPLGRQIQIIRNYDDGTYHPSTSDKDLIEATAYDLAGRVIEMVDVRGTKTVFGYDGAGRRRTATQAAESPVATSSYTCFDRAGRVLRTIQNYIVDPEHPSPDEKDGSGNFLFAPITHGLLDDQNLITTLELDKLGRQTGVTDPIGNQSILTYRKDGQILSQTDPEGTVTVYRYDNARRRTVVVQSYTANGEDPAQWIWDSGDAQWETSAGDPITFGADNDQNILVQLVYDKAGRLLSQREPRGNLTTYDYDLRDRRTHLTNPLSQEWNTIYEDISGGMTRVTLTDPLTFETQRDFDRVGRLETLQYLAESPKLTPDVVFEYDKLGNRTLMSEYTGASFTNRVRETQFTYDDVRRLANVGFDHDGSGSVDETVSYEYDAGGLRTKLSLPGDLDVNYTHDAKGNLITLSEWETPSQITKFSYDGVSRLRMTERSNNLRSQYQVDAGGRLRRLRHSAGKRTLADFAYQVDKRGNRTEAMEMLLHPGSGSTTLTKDSPVVMFYRGSWADDDDFKMTEDFSAAMQVNFAGDEVTLTMGVGPDHSIYDIYIDYSYWNSIDGYATSPDEQQIEIVLEDGGPHTLEIFNRSDRRDSSTGTVLRFMSLETNREYHLHTWSYTYDALARIKTANMFPVANTGTIPLRAYTYGFDVSGNRLIESLSLNDGTPTVTSYTYNAANQISSTGFTYDANGNIINDGTNAYTWDRSNRILSMGGPYYAYDGSGNRIKQTLGAVVTQYLLDLQPSLAVVLAATQNTEVNRYVHGPTGVHAQHDATSNWEWMVNDGLGNVRAVISNDVNILWTGNYDPYGRYFNETGTRQSPYLFTGEYSEPSTNTVYLRSRQYASHLGTFLSRDVSEGMPLYPTSLNAYSWVEGNVINKADPSGTNIDDHFRDNELRELSRMLRAGYPENQLTQQFCTSEPYSPFGCSSGTPIQYAVVQGFAQQGYEAAQSNCPAWAFAGSLYPQHHCGIDIVSYSDPGWTWALFREGGTRKVRIALDTGQFHIAELNEMTDETNRSPIRPVDLSSGRVRLQYNGPSIESSTLGRKVFAMSSGTVTSWHAPTLKILVRDGSATNGIGLEIQYTHLVECSDGSVSPSALVGTEVQAGQLIGCYAKVGSSSYAHLHITYKQVGTEGNELTQDQINTLCHPEDVYLNPIAEVGRGDDCGIGGYGMWISPRGGRFPEHISYGYSGSVPTWEERPY